MTYNQAGGASASPAFSLCSSMQRALLACLALVLLGTMPEASGAPSAQRGYRLAGVMVAGDGYLGFLELPQGDQCWCDSAASSMAARSCSSMRFTTHPVSRRHDRTHARGQWQTPAAAAAPREVVVASESQGHVLRREVDVGELHSALGEANRVASSPAAGTSRPALSAQQVVTQRFQPLLDLPPDARVVAVNETKVISASAAISAVEETLAKGMPARLNLQTPQGMKRVYLMPAGNGTPTKKQKS